jgi:dynein heavy chain
MVEYNLSNIKQINLVFFNDAIANILKITRVLFIQRGNILLIGLGGSGRQVLSKISSFICDL